MAPEPESTLGKVAANRERVDQGAPPATPHPLDADDDELSRPTGRPITALQIAFTAFGAIVSGAIVGVAASLQQGSPVAGLAVAPIAGLILAPLWFTLSRQNYEDRFPLLRQFQSSQSSASRPRQPPGAEAAAPSTRPATVAVTSTVAEPVASVATEDTARTLPTSPFASPNQTQPAAAQNALGGWADGLASRGATASGQFSAPDVVIIVVAVLFSIGVILSGPILAQVILLFWA